MKTKQVIVMRTDLFSGHRMGKFVVQGAHASMLALLDLFNEESITDKYGNHSHRIETQFGDDSVLSNWLNGTYTKVCVGVNSEEELEEIYKKAKATDIPVHLVIDMGLTEFHNTPTKTCLAIGPYISEEIDKITGNLKLL